MTRTEFIQQAAMRHSDGELGEHERVTSAIALADILEKQGCGFESPEARIEQAIQTWRDVVNHKATWDCKAHNEDLYCCLDRDHPNYSTLINLLVGHLR